MNKYISPGKKLFFLALMLSCTHVFAGDLTATRVNSLETSCVGANTSAHFYIPNNLTSLTYYPRDIFYTPNLSIITNTSEISIFQGSANYFWASCNNWSRPANIAQWDNSGYVVASNYDGCVFTKQTPTVPWAPIAQVVYKIHYKEATGLGIGTSLYTYAPEFINGSMNTGITYFQLPDQTKRTWTTEKIHSNECRSYYVSYCGDGVVDNQTFDNGVTSSESCDLWSQNGQPGSACSATCTPVVWPACVPGALTGPQPAVVTAATPGLCPAGQTVGGFASLTVGATTNYTWSCNGSAVGGACSASYTPTGPACVPGTTVWAQSAPVTAATAGLCPVGGVVGGFTSSVAGTVTSYTWSCNGSAVGGACSASFNSSPGGLTCTPGNFTRDTGWVVPIPITISTPGLCPAGETVGNFVDALNGNSHRYSWSCNTISAGLNCVAFYNGGGGGGGGWGWGGGGGGGGTPTVFTIPGSNSYCGDGVVERPNALWIYEDCDTTASWCDSSCHIASTNPGATSPGKLTITTPGSTALDIGTYSLIIGNGVSVFSPNDLIAFQTSTPMYLQNKTATITDKSPLISGSAIPSKSITGGVGGPLLFKESEQREVRNASGVVIIPWTITYNRITYPQSIPLFQGSELQGLKGDTSIISGSYLDTNLTVPMSIGNGLYATLQYLEAPFHIRVSRPIIGNTAGGSAFIGSALGNSVNTVVWTFFNNLRSGNFTTSTVNTSSSYALSSATNSVSDNANLTQKIASGGNSEEGSILRSSTGVVTSNTIVNISSSLELDSKSTRLGDAVNIRVFKNADVSIDSELSLAGVKTIIVENGNLIINKDMVYANKTGSFAWIVKNGNIIIANTVKNIAGVYVTLAGSIASDGVSTPNRLTVDGSLYGTTTDLVNNRSYVRGQTGYSALNVGVVVNYSNRAIMYPPPFLSRFLDQYSLERVAK